MVRGGRPDDVHSEGGVPLTQGSDYDFPMVRGRRPDDVHSEGGTPLPQGFLTFIVVRGGSFFLQRKL